jgi:hypothetical protein
MHSEAAAQVLNYWQAVDDPKQTLGNTKINDMKRPK